jgi:hypothetical protein
MKKRSIHVVQASKDALAADWRGARYVPFAALLLVLTSWATASFYVGQPTLPEFSYDTAGYLQVTQQMLARGNVVDAWRQPGYPSFVALIFVVAGMNNFFAIAIVQGILFVLATLEIYVLAALLFRRAWIAFVVGALVGTNTYLLSFVKPIIVEGYALWLTVSLALAVVLWVKTGKPGYFWLVTLLTLVLFMTRPEWIFLPLPLFAYLLLIAWRRGTLRRFWPHALVSVVLLYGVLGAYIFANATENNFAGVTSNQRVNLLGKVMQYHMQNEAPAGYAQVARVVNTYVAQGGDNPYELALSYPELSQDHWALAGDYANAVVSSHPLEFLAKSVVVFFTSSVHYRAFSQADAGGPVAQPPFQPEVSLSAYIARTYQVFPLFALFWIALAFWRKKARLEMVETMGAVVLLVFYELILVTLGGYTDYDYARLHVPFDPLMIVVIWGTLLASIPLWEGALVRLRLAGRAILWVWGAVVLLSVLGSIAVSWLSSGMAEAFNPQTWLVVRLVVSHPPRLLTVLLLMGLITFLSYWASRRQRLAAGAVEEKESAEALA